MKNRINRVLIAFVTLTSLLLQSMVYAAVDDQGVDWSCYQGKNGIFGYGHNKSAICRIGGVSGGGIYG